MYHQNAVEDGSVFVHAHKNITGPDSQGRILYAHVHLYIRLHACILTVKMRGGANFAYILASLLLGTRTSLGLRAENT